MNPTDWDNAAVREGMRRMLDLRSEYHDRGEPTIGWKLGFGAPVWLDKFALGGPLVGFLPEAARHQTGATVSCEGWVKPVVEPEIAVHIGSDIDDPSQAGAAIGGLSAAIELADVDSPPEDIADVLAGNIFHRAVIIGESRSDVTVADLRARVTRNGSEVADTDDLESLTGEMVSTLGHTAALLGAAGEKLRAGEVVIMGSIIPPIPVEPGDHITFALAPLSPVIVTV